MLVRAARAEDMSGILAVERAAFGGPDEAKLTVALLDDPSAQPIINLVAEDAGTIVGHVLFTHAVVETAEAEFNATVLGPLAVVPTAQRTGVGQALSLEGIAIAGRLGIGLVFVLGHIDYYPRFGFKPASPLGLDAPYPIDPAVADAWMVLATKAGLLGSVRGTVRCADAVMSPEMWVE